MSVLPIPGRAGDVPLWEAGAGVAVIDFSDYRGSDERNTYVLPVPYFVYRGKFLKIFGVQGARRDQCFQQDFIDKIRHLLLFNYC